MGLLLFGIVPFMVGCGDDAGKPSIRHPQDFLPQELGGMTPEGSPTSATTADELRVLIDGGYETYTEHNFQEFALQTYQGTIRESQAEVEVWVFEMPNSDDARALYDDEDLLCAAYHEGLSDIGEQGELCYTNEWQRIQFQRDKYWSRVLVRDYSIDAAEDARTVLRLFATHIDQKIVE